MKNIIEKIKKNWLIKRTTTILFMLILVAIFIGLTLFLNNLKLNPIDFTAEKLYSLTSTSKEQIKTVNQDVNIYFVGYSSSDAKIDLANQYHNENKKINIEVVDATARPDLVSKYGIESGSTGVIVESGEKNKILTSNDFYTYDNVTYEQIDITEEKLTNAILTVIAQKIPKVYFLEGYSEFSINQNMTCLSMYLANEVTEFDTLNIITQGEVPNDCDTLVIFSPSKDFDDIATEAITNYINKGGNILWFNTAITQPQNFENVNKILALYGVKPFEVGFIKETSASKMMTGASSIIIPDVNYSKITKNIPEILVVNATKINFVEDEELTNLNVNKIDLVQASSTAYYRTNFNVITESKQENEEQGPFTIGAMLEKTISNEEEQVKSNMIIYSENLFISDYSLTSTSSYPVIMYSGNKDLVIDTISYLVDREVDIAVRKDTNTINYTATVEQNSLIQTIIFGVPVIIIVVGIIIWQIRRRKNGEPKIKKRKMIEEKCSNDTKK